MAARRMMPVSYTHLVSTGETIWQAKQKCQDLVIVEPHYEQYMKFSKLARGIYGRYTCLLYTSRCV